MYHRAKFSWNEDGVSIKLLAAMLRICMVTNSFTADVCGDIHAPPALFRLIKCYVLSEYTSKKACHDTIDKQPYILASCQQVLVPASTGNVLPTSFMHDAVLFPRAIGRARQSFFSFFPLSFSFLNLSLFFCFGLFHIARRHPPRVPDG